MSSEQFLLTLGVALLVFDSKKLPNLIKNVAYLVATYRRYYQKWVAKVDQVLQQALLEKQLEQNEQKAREIAKKSGDSTYI